MKVNCFLKSANDKRFEVILEKFAKGVESQGDEANLITTEDYENCDVSIIFGSWKNRNTPWHNTKRNVVSKSKKFIVIETPILGRGPVKDVFEDDWYRVGIGGFLAHTGKFHDGLFDNKRWLKIQKELNIEIKPWNKCSDNIVVALQLPGDASLEGCNISKWAYDVCDDVRKYTDKKIILRTPQLQRNYEEFYINKIIDLENVDIQIGTKENLNETLQNSFCSITYSSGLAVDSIINGCPTIVYSPASFAYRISDNFVTLENMKEVVVNFNRENWLNELSYCQWNSNEIECGETWKQMKKILD